MKDFWETIERVRALVRDKNFEYFDAISLILSDLSPEDIFYFDKSFSDAACRLNTTQFFTATLIIRRGLVTDDGFEYFKNWIVLQGQDRFERTVENPDSLAELVIPGANPLSWEAESVEAATGKAYEQKTGRAIETDFPDARGWHELGFDDSKAAISAARKQLPRLTKALAKNSIHP
jgi:hypothetical protein